jgi:hypothetical protein
VQLAARDDNPLSNILDEAAAKVTDDDDNTRRSDGTAGVALESSTPTISTQGAQPAASPPADQNAALEGLEGQLDRALREAFSGLGAEVERQVQEEIQKAVERAARNKF